MTRDQMLLDAVTCEVAAKAWLALSLRPLSALHLAGLVQLALRHPQVDGHNREAGERFLSGVREYFADCPAVLDLLRRGDDPQEDGS